MIRNNPIMKTKVLGNDEKDSENASTKCKQKGQGKKRKRCNSDSSGEFEDVLPENTLEIEKNLHASAVKNNLDDISVRKILKKVVTNDHVLALVKLREEEENSGSDDSHCPKLTRAKARELKKVSPRAAPWNLENLELTPIKHIPVKTRPEVKALIAQELPEDEDDEEYEPTHDDVLSDDDQTMESSSDLDSQPRTPATPQDRTISPKVVKDGPFKVPQNITAQARRKLNLEEEATIARRTRSKLSLSSTPIEHIESTFVPPDELPLPDVDDLWNQFLSECLDPASSTRHEEDDEADPEYNVAADPDAHDEDEESLGNSLIKISKKELNDLVTELFNIMPEGTAEATNGQKQSENGVCTRWQGKQEEVGKGMSDSNTFENQSYTRVSIGKSEQKDPPDKPGEQVQSQKSGGDQDHSNGKDQTAAPSVLTVMVEERQEPAKGIPEWMHRHIKPPEEVQEVVEIQVNANTILPEQIQIFQQQLRQHIQLATSNYLQLYVHPVHWSMAPPFKEYLGSFVKIVEKNPSSVADVCNLQPAWELILSWEKTVAANTPENTAMVEFILKETEKCRRRMASNKFHISDFHSTFMEVVANSNVFLYPYLLPAMPYRADYTRRFAYTGSEDELLALGLEQFWNYVEMNPDLFHKTRGPKVRHRWGLIQTVGLVHKYMFPWMGRKSLLSRISTIRRHREKDNPVNVFLATREVKPVEHKLLSYNPRMTLYEHPEHEMPSIWVRYLSKNSHRFKQYHYSRRHNTAVAPIGVPVNLGPIVHATVKEPLPIHFTKQFKSNRQNARHTKPVPEIPDKYDVNIEPGKPEPIVLRAVTITRPESTISCNTTTYKLVETATGGLLIPVQANITPIMSTVETKSKVPEMAAVPVLAIDQPESSSNSQPKTSPDSELLEKVPKCSIKVKRLRELSIEGKVNELQEVSIDAKVNDLREVSLEDKVNDLPESSKEKDKMHCKCCFVMRRITKRQTKISEYFRPKGSSLLKKDCFCSGVKHPRISNKLRLFLSHYQHKLKGNLRLLARKINEARTNTEVVSDIEHYEDAKDYECASLFQQRLLSSVGISQLTRIKQRVRNLFGGFNIEADDPISLAKQFEYVVANEMVDMYKEFLMLLTPEQAAMVGQFNEYFRRACVDRLVVKIEELVQDRKDREKIFEQLYKTFYDNFSGSCKICCDLLNKMASYPRLAEYTFSLFPHRRKHVSAQVPNIADGARISCVAPLTKTTLPPKSPTPLPNLPISPYKLPTLPLELSTPPLQLPKSPTLPPESPTPSTNFTVTPTKSLSSLSELPTALPKSPTILLKSPTSLPKSPTSLPKSPTSLPKSPTSLQKSPTSSLAKEIDTTVIVTEKSRSPSPKLVSLSNIIPVIKRSMNFGVPADVCPVGRFSQYSSETGGDGYDAELCIDEEASGNEGDSPTNEEDSPINEEDSPTNEEDGPTNEEDGPTIEEDSPTNDSTMEVDETIVKTEVEHTETAVQHIVNHNLEDCELSNTSMCTVYDDESMKPEVCEWTRDEDKLILEVLKDQLTPEERKDKTVIEILEDKNVIQMISDSLTSKCFVDVKDRVLYLVRLLALTEK